MIAAAMTNARMHPAAPHHRSTSTQKHMPTKNSSRIDSRHDSDHSATSDGNQLVFRCTGELSDAATI